MTNTITLKNAKFVGTTFIDGSKQMVGIVRGDSFNKLNVPTDPNPRQFIGDINPNYKEMVKTLKAEPELFARKNSGGITIFATACDSNGDGSYTLTLNKGDGIANGGHTYHALKSYGRDNSQVRVTVEVGLKRDNVVDIAESLNLSRRLPTDTLHNKKGVYDWHKKALGARSSHVIYHEGDTGLIDIKEEIAFLNLFKYDEKNQLDMLHNISQSEASNTKFAVRLIDGENPFENSLKWIARDVHEVVLHATLSPQFVSLLKPLKKSSGQNWIKRRGIEKVDGVVKGLALLLAAGLAAEATTVNKLGITQWKKEYDSFEVRSAFINELFKKVIDIVSVEDGSASEIVRMPSVRKKVLKIASFVGAGFITEAKAKAKEAVKAS